MNDLSTVENAELIFDPKNITKETIKKYLCPKASDQELMMGLQIAKTFNLNPLKREVYFVKYKDDQPMSILTGYEVYLKRAERSNKWNGMEVSSEGKVEDGSLKAVVKVFRKDWEHPLTHEAYYSEYVQKKFDGTINTFWKNKPITMIKKVAVSQAFRFAFPDEFDGMPYTSDEVIDQERIVDLKIEEPLKMPTSTASLQAVCKPSQEAPQTAVAEEVAVTAVEPEKGVIQSAIDTFGGSVVSVKKEFINDMQKEDIKKIAKKKGMNAKSFKEYLIFTFEFGSLNEIPAQAFDMVIRNLESLKDVK